MADGKRMGDCPVTEIELNATQGWHDLFDLLAARHGGSMHWGLSSLLEAGIVVMHMWNYADSRIPETADGKRSMVQNAAENIIMTKTTPNMPHMNNYRIEHYKNPEERDTALKEYTTGPTVIRKKYNIPEPIKKELARIAERIHYTHDATVINYAMNGMALGLLAISIPLPDKDGYSRLLRKCCKQFCQIRLETKGDGMVCVTGDDPNWLWICENKT